MNSSFVIKLFLITVGIVALLAMTSFIVNAAEVKNVIAISFDHESKTLTGLTGTPCHENAERLWKAFYESKDKKLHMGCWTYQSSDLSKVIIIWDEDKTLHFYPSKGFHPLMYHSEHTPSTDNLLN